MHTYAGKQTNRQTETETETERISVTVIHLEQSLQQRRRSATDPESVSSVQCPVSSVQCPVSVPAPIGLLFVVNTSMCARGLCVKSVSLVVLEAASKWCIYIVVVIFMFRWVEWRQLVTESFCLSREL
jgi:hypothetical protein